MRGAMFDGRVRGAALGAALVLAALLPASAPATHTEPGGTAHHTTVQQRVGGTQTAGFDTLSIIPGEGYTTRALPGATADPARATRRSSLLYFGQLSDFQLADEESPARVEFIDSVINPNPFSAAFRPMEALSPHSVERAIDQVNRYADKSPVKQGDGSRAAMNFAITTGDSADSQQRNEVEQVVGLLEGGTVNPNSGSGNPADYPLLGCPPPWFFGSEPGKYTGVQDYDDYFEGLDPVFYDPDNPRGFKFGAWPRYPGLMDRAQKKFTASGLKVPSYVVFGNHDGLVQGNAAANVLFELVATGCIKLMVPLPDVQELPAALQTITPASLSALLASDPTKVALVPPDRKRQFVSKKQYKAMHATGAQADAHGFAYTSAAERAASRDAAGYYSWNPKPGFRFIALDTVSEGGVVGPSADGNIDDPQFRWLEGQLQAATAAGELVVLFSHHAIPSLTAQIPDEVAPPCLLNDAHGHDLNPGCDLDPRNSTPIHLGADLEALVHRYPHVIAWVAGHTHDNKIDAHQRPGGGFWSIRTASEIDWPQQSRLIEVMNNEDGTLSIFGTALDHAAPAGIPAAGTPANTFGTNQLASLSRAFAFNDKQSGAPAGEGTAADRNVELLIDDPR